MLDDSTGNPLLPGHSGGTSSNPFRRLEGSLSLNMTGAHKAATGAHHPVTSLQSTRLLRCFVVVLERVHRKEIARSITSREEVPVIQGPWADVSRTRVRETAVIILRDPRGSPRAPMPFQAGKEQAVRGFCWKPILGRRHSALRPLR